MSSAEQGSSSATTRLQGELERNAQLLVMAQNDVAELRTTKLELETELDGARAAAKDAVSNHLILTQSSSNPLASSSPNPHLILT